MQSVLKELLTTNYSEELILLKKSEYQTHSTDS